MIKLVASDLDGTLFNSEGIIPKSAVDSILKYSKKGIHFAFCTGRGFMEMNDVTKRLPHMQYAITANGAYIYDAWTKQDISKTLIDKYDIKKIYDILKNKDMLFELYIDGKIYCDKKLRQEKLNYIPMQFHDLINASRVLVDDMDNFIDNINQGAIKLHIFFPSTTKRDETYNEIKNLDYEIVSQSINEIEINAKGVNKGSGILKLATKLGIKKQEILAFGDNYNDMSMRNGAGILVAVENAVKELKDIADFVTKSNNEDAIAFALEKFIK